MCERKNKIRNRGAKTRRESSALASGKEGGNWGRERKIVKGIRLDVCYDFRHRK